MDGHVYLHDADNQRGYNGDQTDRKEYGGQFTLIEKQEEYAEHVDQKTGDCHELHVPDIDQATVQRLNLF